MTYRIHCIIATLIVFLSATPSQAQLDELREGEYWNPGLITEAERGHMLVTSVKEGTAAHHFGLKPGDKITQVNERRGFTDTKSFEQAFYDEANAFFGCLLLRVEREGKTHQRLIICDVVWKENGQWLRRKPRHGRLGAYAMLLGAVVNSYETAFDNMPQPRSIREGLDAMARILREWSEAIDLVGTQGLPEDLRRAHQKLVSQIFMANVRLRNTSQNAGKVHIMAVIEREMEKIMDTTTELHALGQFYNDEDKKKRAE